MFEETHFIFICATLTRYLERSEQRSELNLLEQLYEFLTKNLFMFYELYHSYPIASNLILPKARSDLNKDSFEKIISEFHKATSFQQVRQL